MWVHILGGCLYDDRDHVWMSQGQDEAEIMPEEATDRQLYPPAAI